MDQIARMNSLATGIKSLRLHSLIVGLTLLWSPLGIQAAPITVNFEGDVIQKCDQSPNPFCTASAFSGTRFNGHVTVDLEALGSPRTSEFADPNDDLFDYRYEHWQSPYYEGITAKPIILDFVINGVGWGYELGLEKSHWEIFAKKQYLEDTPFSDYIAVGTIEAWLYFDPGWSQLNNYEVGYRKSTGDVGYLHSMRYNFQRDSGYCCNPQRQVYGMFDRVWIGDTQPLPSLPVPGTLALVILPLLGQVLSKMRQGDRYP